MEPEDNQNSNSNRVPNLQIQVGDNRTGKTAMSTKMLVQLGAGLAIGGLAAYLLQRNKKLKQSIEPDDSIDNEIFNSGIGEKVPITEPLRALWMGSGFDDDELFLDSQSVFNEIHNNTFSAQSPRDFLIENEIEFDDQIADPINDYIEKSSTLEVAGGDLQFDSQSFIFDDVKTFTSNVTVDSVSTSRSGREKRRERRQKMRQERVEARAESKAFKMWQDQFKPDKDK